MAVTPHFCTSVPTRPFLLHIPREICIIKIRHPQEVRHGPGHAHAFLDDSDDCLIYNLLFPLERFEMAFQPVLRSHSELSTFLLKTLYTGIRSVSQYFTAFRARYGMSPAEYRQTYRRR